MLLNIVSNKEFPRQILHGFSAVVIIIIIIIITHFNWIFLIVHANHSEEQPEEGCVYEPKHVARNKTTTSNILKVVYDYIIL